VSKMSALLAFVDHILKSSKRVRLNVARKLRFSRRLVIRVEDGP
jgi:hypothetical protein